MRRSGREALNARRRAGGQTGGRRRRSRVRRRRPGRAGIIWKAEPRGFAAAIKKSNFPKTAAAKVNERRERGRNFCGRACTRRRASAADAPNAAAAERAKRAERFARRHAESGTRQTRLRPHKSRRRPRLASAARQRPPPGVRGGLAELRVSSRVQSAESGDSKP